jgi:hypothetical protein
VNWKTCRYPGSKHLSINDGGNEVGVCLGPVEVGVAIQMKVKDIIRMSGDALECLAKSWRFTYLNGRDLLLELPTKGF